MQILSGWNPHFIDENTDSLDDLIQCVRYEKCVHIIHEEHEFHVVLDQTITFHPACS